MIRPMCDVAGCRRELSEPGAVVVSPPGAQTPGQGAPAAKYHVCAECWPWVQGLFTGDTSLGLREAAQAMVGPTEDALRRLSGYDGATWDRLRDGLTRLQQALRRHG